MKKRKFGPSQHINSYRQQPDVESKKPAVKPSTTDLPKTTLYPGTKDAGSMYLPLKLVFAGAAAFILVAGLAHVFVKRRNVQTTVRNYRKGHSTVDDEDDLLISQMYS
uniref:Uncharacterized protein n=1 Tax=Panagrolaimus sp. ES5 TaxID=591445 RepID=A0AC34GX67_9BILA